jgi:exonuclease SbcC
MKPLRLEAQGFGAFREPTEIDFEGAELFALVGPTGSGKSTVIDAICFALYGSVPRYGHKGSVAPIITTGALEARVSLTFEAGGTRYVATRVVRRQKSGSGASTREARLEAVDGDVVAGSVSEIDAAVEDLLGLTFEHFTRAVVLPQNEFARFLHDKPATRQDLLVRLLGFDVYERMMRAARNRAAEQASAVDPSVEARILDALRTSDAPATVVVIAYRQATISLADEVVWLEDGRVLARGSHDQLLLEVPGYAALVRAYSQAEVAA